METAMYNVDFELDVLNQVFINEQVSLFIKCLKDEEERMFENMMQMYACHSYDEVYYE